MFKKQALQIDYWIFILGYIVFSLLAFQTPFFSYLKNIVDINSADGALKLVIVQVISFLLWSILLGFAGLLSRLVLKAFAIVFVFLNAVAVTLMIQYSAIINKEMIGNIVFTDSSEVSGFVDLKTVLFIVLLGVVPAIVIVMVKIKPIGRMKRLAGAVMAVVALGLVVTLAPQTTKWIDKNGRNLGSRLLPWSYIGNGVHFYRDLKSGYYGRYFGEFEQLADATPETPEYDLVVLVVGESARAKSYSHYGYERPTNQFTADAGYVALPVSKSCDTHTMITTSCILSVFGKNDFNEIATEPLPSYLQRQGVPVFVRTNNTEMPRLKVENYKTSSQLSQICTTPECLTYNRTECQGGSCVERYQDNILLADVGEIMTTSKSTPVLLVLHLRGSHGPNYYERSPEDFVLFKPICKGNLRSCTPEELNNTYDNSIAFTDWTLAQLSSVLSKQVDVKSLVLYLSDHGESLGENGKYMHAAPLDEAPIEQLEIPFLIWASDLDDKRDTIADAIQKGFDAQDVVFHTILGALGFRSGPYDAERDIFH